MRLHKEYQFKREIHRGSRSVVWRVEHAGEPLIAKGSLEDRPSPNTVASIRNQYQIQKSLDHPGIVKTINLVSGKENPVIIMEDANRIAVRDWLSGPLDIPTFLDIAIQLVEAMVCCHGERVIHKDINPNNILIRPSSRKICLTDFGIAAHLPRDNHSLPRPSTIQGTVEYLAPEQTDQSKLSGRNGRLSGQANPKRASITGYCLSPAFK